MKRIGILLYRFLNEIIDVRRLIQFPRNYASYLWALARYSQKEQRLSIRLLDLHPRIQERTWTTFVEPHYFYQSNWALERVLQTNPTWHVDIASQIDFVKHLAVFLPVIFVDIRPIELPLKNLTCYKGSVLNLPFQNGSVPSLSCLHVIEHIGLGRYGDTLDPYGEEKAASEIARILSPNAMLYLSTPIGKPRICFNAHRILPASQVIKMFEPLRLQEFSIVDDQGRFIPNTRAEEYDNSDYACGMFIFRKSL